MSFLPPNQQRQSTERTSSVQTVSATAADVLQSVYGIGAGSNELTQLTASLNAGRTAEFIGRPSQTLSHRAHCFTDNR